MLWIKTFSTVLSFSKQSQQSISILQDESRLLGLFWKQKLYLIAELPTRLIYIFGVILEGGGGEEVRRGIAKQI